MKRFPISIEPDVFALLPGYRRAIVSVSEVRNEPSPAGLVELLGETTRRLRDSTTVEGLVEDPRIADWRAAFKRSGTNPSKTRPSVEALARRVCRGDDLLPINNIVDIGTVVSLQYLLPVGAHATDDVSEGLALRRAAGTEHFTPFGAPDGAAETAEPGEVIFTDGERIATRRWVWRQAQHTSIAAETSSVEFNVDAAPAIDDSVLDKATGALADLIEAYLGAVPAISVLSQSKPTIEVEVSPT